MSPVPSPRSLRVPVAHWRPTTLRAEVLCCLSCLSTAWPSHGVQVVLPVAGTASQRAALRHEPWTAAARTSRSWCPSWAQNTRWKEWSSSSTSSDYVWHLELELNSESQVGTPPVAMGSLTRTLGHILKDEIRALAAKAACVSAKDHIFYRWTSVFQDLPGLADPCPPGGEREHVLSGPPKRLAAVKGERNWNQLLRGSGWIRPKAGELTGQADLPLHNYEPLKTWGSSPPCYYYFF